jgi:hypothetical protein
VTRILGAFVLLYACLALCLIALVALVAVALYGYARRRYRQAGDDEPNITVDEPAGSSVVPPR